MAQKKDTVKGTWYFYGSYVNYEGVRKQYKKRGFATKKEAKEAERLFRLQHNQEKAPTTLDDVFNLFHANFSEMHLKESSLYTTEGYYRNHIQSSLGKLKLSSFSVPFMEQWKSELMRKKKDDGTLYNARTLSKIMGVVSTYFSYAVRLGYMEYNPCSSLSPIKRQSSYNPTFWELDDYKKFITCVDDERWKCVFSFLYGTGVREGELFALQWKDIDLDKNVCSISKTLTSRTNKGSWSITPPKNSRSIRNIDLQDTLVDSLKSHLESQKKKDGFSMNWYVFGSIKPLLGATMRKYLDYYIEKADVPRITPHGFRHSHASLLIRNGIDDQLIADRLGHSPSELRRTYAHIYKESREELVDKLNKLL